MGDDVSPETEVAFLRSQVVSLQSRLCETLSQQVAQQQTVLIAAMQTNLALTQTVDKMNRIADVLTEMADKEEEDRAEPSPGMGADFSAVLAALAPYLLSGAGGASQPKPNPEAPALAPNPFVLPKEIQDLMRRRAAPGAAPGAAQKAPAAEGQPGQDPSTQDQDPNRARVAKMKIMIPRPDGTGHDVYTRVETGHPYPGLVYGSIQHPSAAQTGPVPKAPVKKARARKTNPKESNS